MKYGPVYFEDVKVGDEVKVADGYDTNMGKVGSVYRYVGAADANGIAMMLRKSLAGLVRVITTVEALGALMPDTALLFMYFAIAVALDALTFANPLQKFVNPAMVSS